MIRLKDHDPDLFQAFVHWVYTKEIDLLHLVRPDGTKCLFPPWLSMGKLWALAHYLDHTPLRDATIDAMLYKMRGHPDLAIAPDSLNAIFDTTPENSTIQRLLLEFSAARYPGSHSKREIPKLPLALVHYLAAKFLAGASRPYPVPTPEDRCQYHEHGKDEGCWDSKK